MYVSINLTGEKQIGELIDVVTASPKASEKLKEEMARLEQEWFYQEPQLQIVEE